MGKVKGWNFPWNKNKKKSNKAYHYIGYKPKKNKAELSFVLQTLLF